MSDILFDILQIGDEANGFQWNIEVSGPQALNTGDFFCINADTLAAVQFSLVTELSLNLYCAGIGYLPLVPVIPPGTMDQPVDPGLCCEIRNSTEHSVPIELLNTGFTVIDSATLSSLQSLWFFTENPVTDTVLSPDPCCVAAGTLVETPNGPISVQNLHAGDTVLDHNGVPVVLLKVVRYKLPSSDFIKLGQLLIRSGHPVLDFDFQERPCQTLPEACPIQVNRPRPVFTLVTGEKSFIPMNGYCVATWSSKSWASLASTMPPFVEL